MLLAEDDPVSREFLREATHACGAQVTDCADGHQALVLARKDPWDLLILDHHLPGLNGDVLLALLRADPLAASRATPAIATSAARDIEADALERAGFAEVLAKPMGIETLRGALRRHGCALDPRLDDADALRACGSRAAVTRLRRLFAEQELPSVQDELDAAGEDLRALLPTLHRLRASCGFCGARSLAEASANLSRAITARPGVGQRESALEAFCVAMAETRAALHIQLDDDA
ncbi:MAG TPA: response regulator [Rhodanobacteraceae bacterium]|nr:response regulator [Rhodanobacteraceae bacterium]